MLLFDDETKQVTKYKTNKKLKKFFVPNNKPKLLEYVNAKTTKIMTLVFYTLGSNTMFPPGIPKQLGCET